MEKKKITGIFLSSPLGGVGVGKTEALKNAKAFEAGCILQGTYITFMLETITDEEFNISTGGTIERVSAYLKDLGIKNINLSDFKPSMTYEHFNKMLTSVNNQLWGKGGVLGLHFENAMHMVAELNDKMKFIGLASELNIPKNLLEKEDSPYKTIILIRNYYKKIIFNSTFRL
jgi:hypothetical protein